MREGRLARVRHPCCVSPAKMQMEGEGRTFQGEGLAWLAQAEARRWVPGQVCRSRGWAAGTIRGVVGREKGGGLKPDGDSRRRWFLSCH